jgi:hypothetical protein
MRINNIPVNLVHYKGFRALDNRNIAECWRDDMLQTKGKCVSI